MDPFLIYLIAVNVVAFLAFAVDFFLCMRFPALDDSTINALILDIFPVAGGAVGMLIALFVFGGRGRGHRMNKDNIAWWFLAISCLIVWGLVVAVRYGLVTLDAGAAGVVSGWNLSRLKILGIYLAIINVVTFVVFAWDKPHSGERKRLREASARGAPAGALPDRRVRGRYPRHACLSAQDAEVVLRVGLAGVHRPGHRSHPVRTHGWAHLAGVS